MDILPNDEAHCGLYWRWFDLRTVGIRCGLKLEVVDSHPLRHELSSAPPQRRDSCDRMRVGMRTQRWLLPIVVLFALCAGYAGQGGGSACETQKSACCCGQSATKRCSHCQSVGAANDCACSVSATTPISNSQSIGVEQSSNAVAARIERDFAPPVGPFLEVSISHLLAGDESLVDHPPNGRHPPRAPPSQD